MKGYFMNIYVLYDNIKKYGFFVGVIRDIRLIINKTYSCICYHHLHTTFDITSKISGSKNIVFGKRVLLGRYLRIEAISRHDKKVYKPQIIVKNNVSIGDFCHIGAIDYIEIGNNVLFGSKCYVTDHNHGIYSSRGVSQSNPKEPPNRRTLLGEKVIIGDNVWIGDNVVILPGVTIGNGSIIGANAVVTNNIPPESIAVGLPARVIKRWNSKLTIWEKI